MHVVIIQDFNSTIPFHLCWENFSLSSKYFILMVSKILKMEYWQYFPKISQSRTKIQMYYGMLFCIDKKNYWIPPYHRIMQFDWFPRYLWSQLVSQLNFSLRYLLTQQKRGDSNSNTTSWYNRESTYIIIFNHIQSISHPPL